MTTESPRIFVAGSSNTDIVLSVSKIPSPGETVNASGIRYGRGGKGANQAVAASRAGAEVFFAACVGEDECDRSFRFVRNKCS
ncbi:MAG: PfkB family carbohydrate kinase [Fibrobacterota bacterium]